MSLPGRVPDDPPITDHRKLAKQSLAYVPDAPCNQDGIAQLHALTAIAHALLAIDRHLAQLRPATTRRVNR
jgi:hypothetical protein